MLSELFDCCPVAQLLVLNPLIRVWRGGALIYTGASPSGDCSEYHRPAKVPYAEDEELGLKIRQNAMIW